METHCTNDMPAYEVFHLHDYVTTSVSKQTKTLLFSVSLSITAIMSALVSYCRNAFCKHLYRSLFSPSIARNMRSCSSNSNDYQKVATTATTATIRNNC